MVPASPCGTKEQGRGGRSCETYKNIKLLHVQLCTVFIIDSYNTDFRESHYICSINALTATKHCDLGLSRQLFIVLIKFNTAMH